MPGAKAAGVVSTYGGSTQKRRMTTAHEERAADLASTRRALRPFRLSDGQLSIADARTL
jgi:hypothetical protein